MMQHAGVLEIWEHREPQILTSGDFIGFPQWFFGSFGKTNGKTRKFEKLSDVHLRSPTTVLVVQ